MSYTIPCKYCHTEYHWHRILRHCVKDHKNDFLTDTEHRTTLNTFFNRKEGVSKVMIEKGSQNLIWCCFGCMKLFSREHYKDKHLKEHKSCKEKHIAFEEENKMIFLDTNVASKIASDEDSKVLLAKIKLLEQQNMKLKQRLQEQTESANEEVEKRMAFQEIVDEELPTQHREVFKRILARKNPALFKDLYDEYQYEVSVSDSDEEQHIEEHDEEEEKEEEPPYIPPRNILVSAKPAQQQYRIYHDGDDVFFRDSQDILYDKNYRGEYIRQGYIKNGEVIWD